jgi:3-dehydroquinate dehydratase/shikimate dehydrogenase
VSPIDFEPICVVIGRSRHGMIRAEVDEAARQGAQFIELRLDILAKAPDFQRLLLDKPCPMLATVRRGVDGGRWKASEDARKTLLRQAIVAGFDWVDLETDVIDSIPRFGDVKRIVSYHNTREAPADLEKIHAKMCKQDADVVKIAVRAATALDNLRLLRLVKNASKPTVAFCMGDLGTPSRLLGAKYGAPFTYSAFNKERGIAPGLPGYQELKKIYYYPQINPKTRIFGVIGDPVSHSLSPLIHNRLFREGGVDAVYVPFRVPRGELQPFLKGFDELPVDGYSVTIPHKEDAVELSAEQDETVQRTRAANTLVRGQDGFIAYNTDYQAAVDALKEFLTRHPPPVPEGAIPPAGYDDLATKSILVLGAGGIARAVAHALHDARALVTVVNRTPERAHKLAAEIGCRTVDWAGRHSVLCDVVVNCTSVGMHPRVDEAPLHHSFFKPGMVLFETVYTPETTLLVKEARSRGSLVLTGVELFVRQAALQSKLFTGQTSELERLRRQVRKALSPVTIREED